MVEIAKFINLGGKQKKLPMHLAISCSPIKSWCEDKKKAIPEMISRNFETIDQIIDYQVKNQIRVLTLLFADKSPEFLQAMKEYFARLIEADRINKNQVRLFAIGQWYDLDSDLSETLKLGMEKTKLYDNYFLNFCLNYDGREEVLGAVRLLTRKILAGKATENDLSEGMVKENLYSSYFPPPQLIIETRESYSGVLLWDAQGSVIYYSGRKWPLFDMSVVDKAITFYDELGKED